MGIVEHAVEVRGDGERAGEQRDGERGSEDRRPPGQRTRRALQREPHAERRRQRQRAERTSVGDRVSLRVRSRAIAGARAAGSVARRRAPTTVPSSARASSTAAIPTIKTVDVDVRARIELGLLGERQEQVLRAEHRQEAGDHRARTPRSRAIAHERDREQLTIAHSQRAQHRQLRRFAERLARQRLTDRHRSGERRPTPRRSRAPALRPGSISAPSRSDSRAC